MFFSLIHACLDSRNYIIKSKWAPLSKGGFATCLATMFYCIYNRNHRMTLLFLFGKLLPSASLPMLAQRGEVIHVVLEET